MGGRMDGGTDGRWKEGMMEGRTYGRKHELTDVYSEGRLDGLIRLHGFLIKKCRAFDQVKVNVTECQIRTNNGVICPTQ